MTCCEEMGEGLIVEENFVPLKVCQAFVYICSVNSNLVARFLVRLKLEISFRSSVQT